MSEVDDCSKKVGELWAKLFPFKVGDRVKVIRASKYAEMYQNVFVGRYGTIDAILPVEDNETDNIFVKLDNPIRGRVREMHCCDKDLRRVRIRKRNLSRES